MSYEIVIGQTKLFRDNPIFKEFNPSVDITVDFRNRDIYEFFMHKVFADYRRQVMSNIINLQTNHHILLKLLDKHPELNDEVIDIINKIDKEELSDEFFNKILPKPEI